MDYPQDFPAESRAKVEAARLRAGRKLDLAIKRLYGHSSGALLGRIRPAGIEDLFWKYTLTSFLVFADETYRLRLWSMDEMKYRCEEALRHFVIEAYHHKGTGIVAKPTDEMGGIRRETKQEIEKKPQWRKYENLLLKLAEESPHVSFHVGLIERNRHLLATAEASPGQRPDKPNQQGRVTNIGRNISRLRKECGWSIDQLAKETGIDKKSILSHLNKGTRPIPRILKEYAQAFSKALNRTIIAPDLEV